jgi:hypothetical protein
MGMRIWHQSFTVLGDLPGYEDAMRRHLTKYCGATRTFCSTVSTTAFIRETTLATDRLFRIVFNARQSVGCRGARRAAGRLRRVCDVYAA